MKKTAPLLLLLSVLITSNTFSQSYIKVIVKGSYDLLGKYIVNLQDENPDFDILNDFTIAAEIVREREGILNFGAGVQFLLPRKFETNESAEFSFTSLYAIFEIKPFESTVGFYPSLLGHIGYSINHSGNQIYGSSSNLGNGMYIGGGLRFTYDSFFIEGIYKSFNGSRGFNQTDQNHNERDIIYNVVSVGLGIKIL